MDEILVLDNGVASITPQTLKRYKQLKKQVNEFERLEKQMKDVCYDYMLQNDIPSIDIDDGFITITLVKPTTANTFDSKAFKADHADLYEQYVKSTPKKGYVRIG